jgi:hypothetical protein
MLYSDLNYCTTLYCDHIWESALNEIWTHNFLVASKQKCPAVVQLHHQICERERDMATYLLARMHFCTLLKAAQIQVNNCPIITNNIKLAVLKDTWRRVYMNSLGILTF